MSTHGGPRTVEVRNLLYAVSAEQLRARVNAMVGDAAVASLVCEPRSSRASIEVTNVQSAGKLVNMLRAARDLSFQGRGLRVELLAAVADNGYTEADTTRRWPFEDRTALTAEKQAAANHADLLELFTLIPDTKMRDSLWMVVSKERTASFVLKEIYLAVGRRCELVFAGSGDGRRVKILRSENPTTVDHVRNFLHLFDALPAAQRRTGVSNTLHRISRTVHAVTQQATAVTARVGRTIQGHVLPMLECMGDDADQQLRRLVERGLMLIGPPNVGKTTVLRELARLLSRGADCVVVVVDKSLEIAGTAEVPHAAIGNSRVLTVGGPGQQAQVMLEAVENQSPDVVIVDELSTREECDAARTIIGRGVALIASVHGEAVSQIINDPERSILIGGVGSVTLSAHEAETRPDKLRQVQRRHANPVFGAAVELRAFSDWILHTDVERAVDAYLDYRPFAAGWIRARGSEVERVPVVGWRGRGSEHSYVYLKLRPGERVVSSSVDLSARAPNGFAMWARASENAPHVYEGTHPSDQHQPFVFDQRSDESMQEEGEVPAKA